MSVEGQLNSSLAEGVAVVFRYDPETKHVWWGHVCTVGEAKWDAYYAEHNPNGNALWTRRCLQLPNSPEKGWTIERVEPLTVSPSILCATCGVHGWIRDGIWVKA